MRIILLMYWSLEQKRQKGNNEKLWWNDEENEKYKNLCWLEHVAIHKTEAVRGNEENLCCDEMMNEEEKYKTFEHCNMNWWMC